MRKIRNFPTGLWFPVTMAIALFFDGQEMVLPITAAYLAVRTLSLGASQALGRCFGGLINRGKVLFSTLMSLLLCVFGTLAAWGVFRLTGNVGSGIPYTVLSAGMLAGCGCITELFAASEDTTSAVMTELLAWGMMCAAILFFHGGMETGRAWLGVSGVALLIALGMMALTCKGDSPSPTAAIAKELPVSMLRTAAYPALAALLLNRTGITDGILYGCLGGIFAQELLRTPFARDSADSDLLPAVSAGALLWGVVCSVCAVMAPRFVQPAALGTLGAGLGLLFYAPRNVRGIAAGVIAVVAALVVLLLFPSLFVLTGACAAVIALSMPDILLVLRRAKAMRIRRNAKRLAARNENR